MLSEARARLANTQGKKAKRKAREKQLEEARRLAALQKRRELRAAGITVNQKNKKKRGVNYNTEIPFEKKPSHGFYDTSTEIIDPLAPDFSRMRQQHLDGELRTEKEEIERRKDKQKLKQRKENDIPMGMLNNEEPARKRSKLVLPEPQITDQELQQVVKLGRASEVITHLLSAFLFKYIFLLFRVINICFFGVLTLFTGCSWNCVWKWRDIVRQFAGWLFVHSNSWTNSKNSSSVWQNSSRGAECHGSHSCRHSIERCVISTCWHLKYQQYFPFWLICNFYLGGLNTPLHNADFNGIAPASSAVATPNTVLATPFRSQRGGDATPGVSFNTPGSTRPQKTIAATPVRDRLSINPEENLDGSETPALQKQVNTDFFFT